MKTLPWRVVPAVWRQRAYWRCVARFVVFGPMIGGLPYNLLVLPIPFSYAIGGVPAALAGLGFAAWWCAPGRRVPGLLSRVVMGALCGLAGCALTAWALNGQLFGADVFRLDVLALHGVPAAMWLAGWQRAVRPRPPALTCP